MLENLKIGDAYEGFLFLAESVRNPPVLRPHHHVELELNLVVEGEITYVMGGQRYRFPKRSLLWFFPAQEHQLVDRSGDAAYYVAVFKPDLIRRACKGERYRDLKKKRPKNDRLLHRDLEPLAFEPLRKEMDAVVEDGMHPDILNREAGFGVSADFTFQHNDPDWLNAGLRHLLLHAWRLQMRPGEGGRAVALHPAVRDVLEFIEKEEEAGLGLEELADQCGVSASFLSRRFREQVGVPLSRYRNSIRLGRFWEEYRRAPSQPLLQLVLEAGFGSYAQFYRIFKEAYGNGPREVLSRRV